jgi:CxxC-x17-CxxC domain-containing protein
MKNFNGPENRGGGYKGGDRGGKPSFQNKSWGVDRGQSYGSTRDKPLFKATCSDCKKSCEVPFRPSGDKPVFCSDCFNAKRDIDDSRGHNQGFENRAPKRDFNDRHAPRVEYSRPSDPRAPFKPNALPAVNDDTKRQLSDISFKLDKLISAIEKINTPVVPIVTKVPTPKVETKKVVEKQVVKAPVVKKVIIKKIETPVAKKKVVVKKVVSKKK